MGDLTLTDIRDRATITLEQFAALVGVSRDNAYKAARDGQILVRVVGRRKLVPVPWLLNWLGEPSAHDAKVDVEGA